MACLSNGNYKIIQTIPSSTLTCMYGGQASTIQALIDGIIVHADNWMKRKLPLSDYKPILSNAYCSDTVTMNVATVEDLLQVAIQNTASLASLNFIEDTSESDPKNQGSRGLAGRFVKQVKSAVIDLNPNLKGSFGVSLGGIHRYHFVANGYIANLGAMNPASAYNSINESKRLLWDLSVVKDYDWTIERQELIIYMPKDDKITYSKKQYSSAKDALQKFEQEADKKSIRLITTSSPDEARDRLIKAA